MDHGPKLSLEAYSIFATVKQMNLARPGSGLLEIPCCLTQSFMYPRMASNSLAVEDSHTSNPSPSTHPVLALQVCTTNTDSFGTGDGNQGLLHSGKVSY